MHKLSLTQQFSVMIQHDIVIFVGIHWKMRISAPETSIGPRVAMPLTPARCSLYLEGSVSSLEPSAKEWRQSESDRGRDWRGNGLHQLHANLVWISL